MNDTATAETVVRLPIASLRPHPKNTHGKLGPKHPRVIELAEQIRVNTQLEPCVVREIDREVYEILSGHIRTAAQQLLGAETVPCIVKDVDAAGALTIVLTSNEKEPVDPLLEAEAIEALLAEKGGDLRAVATALSKPVRYVAARANLTKLSKTIRKLYADGELATWTIGMLEQLARLSPEAQDELAAPAKGGHYKIELSRIDGLDHLKQIMGNCFRELANATWKLDDATLCPAAGPCTTCPKTSLRSPGLFDDGDLDPQDPAALKKGVCRDALCWREKAGAVAKAAIAEAKKAAEGELLVVREGRDAPVPKGVKALESWEARDVKKGTKGAVPAVFLGEDGSLKKGFAVPPRARPSSSPAKASTSKKPAKEKKEPKPGDKNFAEKLEASKKEVAERRAAFMEAAAFDEIDAIRTSPKKHAHIDCDVIEGLLVAFGASAPGYDLKKDATPEGSFAHVKELYELRKLSAAKDWHLEMLPRVLDHVTDEVRHNGSEASRWVAGLLGVDLEVLEKKAAKEIPDPKWWREAPKADAAAFTHVYAGVGSTVALCGLQVEKRTDFVDLAIASCPVCRERAPGFVGKKKGAKAKPADKLLIADAQVVEGVCGGCGCTHDKACPNGCSWARLPDPKHTRYLPDGRKLHVGTCSSCAGDQPKGRKKAKR